MEIEFDPLKDAANLAKHGVSLARAHDLEVIKIVDDARFNEPRSRPYGVIDGKAHCAAVTRRGDRVRVISLRRAHAKEMERHAR